MTLPPDLSLIVAQLAYQRRCQAVASFAGPLLTELDRFNCRPLWATRAGRIYRHVDPDAESVMCALRAELAELVA